MKTLNVDGNWLSVDESYFQFGSLVDWDYNPNTYFCDFPMCLCRDAHYKCRNNEPFATFGATCNYKINRLCIDHYGSIFKRVQETKNMSVAKDQGALYVVEFECGEPYLYFKTKEALLSAISNRLDEAEFNDNFSIEFEKKKLED